MLTLNRQCMFIFGLRFFLRYENSEYLYPVPGIVYSRYANVYTCCTASRAKNEKQKPFPSIYAKMHFHFTRNRVFAFVTN